MSIAPLSSSTIHNGKDCKAKTPATCHMEDVTDIDKKRKDNDANGSDLQSWSEFTQNTTFHGVKYIFEETPFALRRLVLIETVTHSRRFVGHLLSCYFILVILDVHLQSPVVDNCDRGNGIFLCAGGNKDTGLF